MLSLPGEEPEWIFLINGGRSERGERIQLNAILGVGRIAVDSSLHSE